MIQSLWYFIFSKCKKLSKPELNKLSKEEVDLLKMKTKNSAIKLKGLKWKTNWWQNSKRRVLGNANTMFEFIDPIWLIKIGETMNNKYQDCKRQFIQLSKSYMQRLIWKSKDIQDEIILILS